MHERAWDSTLLAVGLEPQLFVDNLLIDSVQDTTRRWHTPRRRQDGPLFTEDRPWEHRLWTAYYGSTTVLRDPDDGLFKCWYQDQEGAPAPGEGAGSRPPANFAMRATLLYAESADGVRWRKPELDVRSAGGQRTNIVLGGGAFGDAHAMTVVLDPYPPRPEERFRGMLRRIWYEGGARRRVTTCVHSPDGIHWSRYRQAPVFGSRGGSPGDVNILWYDRHARQFVVNVRAHLGGLPGAVDLRHPYRAHGFLHPYRPHLPLAQNKRRVWQSRSHDFLHWSEPVLIAVPDDDEDGLDEGYYGLSQFRIGHQHLGAAGLFRAVDNTLEVQLLQSRDGLRWRPAAKRQPFLAPRGPGHWDAWMASLFSPPIDVGSEHWFYQGGFNYHHDWFLAGPNEALDHPEARNPGGASGGLGLVTLRRHGFASLSANAVREGIVVTHPVSSPGRRLAINARCRPGGSIRVEAADRRGEVLGLTSGRPCSRDACDPITGDSVEHAVTWSGDPRAPAPEGDGDWRVLRFFLRDADLFSFTFLANE